VKWLVTFESSVTVAATDADEAARLVDSQAFEWTDAAMPRVLAVMPDDLQPADDEADVCDCDRCREAGRCK